MGYRHHFSCGSSGCSFTGSFAHYDDDHDDDHDHDGDAGDNDDDDDDDIDAYGGQILSIDAP